MGLLIEDWCEGDVSGEASPNSVGELRQHFAYFAERTVNGWLNGCFADFIRHKSQLDKEIHEEWIAILALLRHLDVPNETSLRLGGKKERWDAKIGESLFIEVSRAAPDNDHKFRQMMADGGYRTIVDRWRHALSQQRVCDVVIERINAKLEKKYPQGTILVISVSGDATNEDDNVVESWLPRIRKSVSLGGFSSIYIVEEARQKAFQIL